MATSDEDREKRSLVYEELRALPENFVGEIVYGELVASPRPAPPHALASSVLGAELIRGFHLGRGGPGGWWILDEPELHLGDDVLVPDLGGWRRERMQKLPDEAYFALAPDWICEVLSPSTAALDRIRKLKIYGREGVGHAWLLDPSERSLEVFRRTEGGWNLVAGFIGTEAVRAEPFEELELNLGDLWEASTEDDG